MVSLLEESIPQKIRRFSAFALILLNDEESFNDLQLPAELDPLLARDQFQKVCFIFLMARPASVLQSKSDEFVNTTKEKIFDKLFSRHDPL